MTSFLDSLSDQAASSSSLHHNPSDTPHISTYNVGNGIGTVHDITNSLAFSSSTSPVPPHHLQQQQQQQQSANGNLYSPFSVKVEDPSQLTPPQRAYIDGTSSHLTHLSNHAASSGSSTAAVPTLSRSQSVLDFGAFALQGSDSTSGRADTIVLSATQEGSTSAAALAAAAAASARPITHIDGSYFASSDATHPNAAVPLIHQHRQPAASEGPSTTDLFIDQSSILPLGTTAAAARSPSVPQTTTTTTTLVDDMSNPSSSWRGHISPNRNVPYQQHGTNAVAGPSRVASETTRSTSQPTPISAEPYRPSSSHHPARSNGPPNSDQSSLMRRANTSFDTFTHPSSHPTSHGSGDFAAGSSSFSSSATRISSRDGVNFSAGGGGGSSATGGFANNFNPANVSARGSSPQKPEDVTMGDDDEEAANDSMYAGMDEIHSSSSGVGGFGGSGGGDGAGAGQSSSTGNRNRSTSGAGGSGDAKDSGGSVARRQNTACDACRSRKVKCLRTPGEEKCNHCKTKGIECTTVYVQLATSGGKRAVKRTRGDGLQTDADMSISGATREEDTTVLRYLLLRDGEYPDVVLGLSYVEAPGKRLAPATPAEARLINTTARHEFVSSLLETYFSTVHIRYPVLDPKEFLQRYHYSTPELGGAPPDVLMAVLLAWGAKFSKHPIIVADRRETASEELTPSQRIRRSIKNPLSASTSGTRGASSVGEAANVGTARPHSNSDAQIRVMGRSRIAEDLIVKAQEVLDRNKAHRNATMDHAKAAMIIQALFWQQASQSEEEIAISPSQLRSRKRRGVYICNGVWVMSAISHMFEMKVHLRETVNQIVDLGQRGQVAMTWWLACMFDSHMSAFYRRKPALSVEDYTTDPPAAPMASPEAGPSPLASEQGYRVWINSALDQCEMMRSVYYTLWTPISQQEGVSARKLEKLVSMAYNWRSNHLALVGAPDPDWPSHWRFSDAITACSSDINYQIIWILMWQALDEFGIAELKCTDLTSYNMSAMRHGFNTNLPSSVAEMEVDRSKIRGMSNAIYEEALKAALRGADLARMLCDFDYLQNEAGIMKFALCEAGYCLTRFKRPEVVKVIDGLRQYGQAFEECYEQADELERLASEYMTVSGQSGNVYGGGGGGMVSAPTQPQHVPSTTTYGSLQGFVNNDIINARKLSADAMAGVSTGGGATGVSGGGHNVLPSIGRRMVDNLGQDPNAGHPGTHLMAQQFSRRSMSGSVQLQEPPLTHQSSQQPSPQQQQQAQQRHAHYHHQQAQQVQQQVQQQQQQQQAAAQAHHALSFDANAQTTAFGPRSFSNSSVAAPSGSSLVASNMGYSRLSSSSSYPYTHSGPPNSAGSSGTGFPASQSGGSGSGSKSQFH